MNVLIVDNYDSFTYNLYQFAGELLEDRSGQFKLDVYRNDEIDLAGVESNGYDRIILSPGPGDPADPAYFGVCMDILKGPARHYSCARSLSGDAGHGLCLWRRC